MQKRHQYWKLDNANKVDEISRAKLISFISTPKTSCTCPKLGFYYKHFCLDQTGNAHVQQYEVVGGNTSNKK